MIVTVDEVKTHLRIQHDEENDYIESLIKQAQTAAEDYCRVSFEEPDEDGNVPEAPEPVRLAVILMTSFYYENRDIPDMTTYKATRMAFDSLLYPYSYAKKTKGKNPRTETSCLKYADAFMEELQRAEACDPAAKKEKIRSFAQSLLDNGGPAVNQMRKMFGEEIAKRLVLQHMYGAE